MSDQRTVYNAYIFFCTSNCYWIPREGLNYRKQIRWQRNGTLFQLSFFVLFCHTKARILDFSVSRLPTLGASDSYYNRFIGLNLFTKARYTTSLRIFLTMRCY